MNRRYSIAAIAVLMLFGVLAWSYTGGPNAPVFAAPKPPSQAYDYSLYRTGPYEVAKVLGRSSGCQDATPDFIEMINTLSLKAGLDPRVAAATIAVESSCNQFAVSSKGALGVMQIYVPVWKDKFDFGGNVNLLNPRDNIEVGTKIMAELIFSYGMEEGLKRYNGLGIGSDPAYVTKILTLAGRR